MISRVRTLKYLEGPVFNKKKIKAYKETRKYAQFTGKRNERNFL